MTVSIKRISEEAARWFARMRDAEPDHPQRGRFEAWLMESPLHAREYQAMVGLWEDFDTTDKLQSLASAMERKNSEARAERGRKMRKAATQGIMGVLVAVASLVGYNAWHEWAERPVYRLASATGIGEIVRQGLADGSQLTLNAGTRVEVAYFRDRRTVKLLQGEAVFEVEKDPSRPFVVDSGHALVTVLGTRFAVNHLTGLVRVSVDHGRVRVEARNAAGKITFPPIVLHDGEVAEINSGEMPERIQRNAGDAFGFQHGSLAFEHAALSEIAETLSRYRKMPVRAETQPWDGPRVTAIVQIADIETFLRALPDIAPVRVRQANGETRLAGRGG